MIQTPTLDRLAAEGISYNNFHTTALCSPTRNALKTGRNHHTTNTGSIMESSTGFPGNTGQVPKEWIDKYKGKFDAGWDDVREKTVARQKERGIIPANTKLAPKPKDIKD